MSQLLLFLMILNFDFGINEYLQISSVVLAGLSTFTAVIISGQKSEELVSYRPKEDLAIT